jgi:hypothetical protein
MFNDDRQPTEAVARGQKAWTASRSASTAIMMSMSLLAVASPRASEPNRAA